MIEHSVRRLRIENLRFASILEQAWVHRTSEVLQGLNFHQTLPSVAVPSFVWSSGLGSAAGLDERSDLGLEAIPVADELLRWLRRVSRRPASGCWVWRF